MTDTKFFLSNGHTGRGHLLLASCTSANSLARNINRRYLELVEELHGTKAYSHLENIDSRFSDGEALIRLNGNVRETDAYLIQTINDPTSNLSIDDNYMAFLIAIRALKEQGANRITGVLPYLAYARQDKPTLYKREPTTSRLMADLCNASGLNQLITWHAHAAPQGNFAPAKVDALDSLTLFTREFSIFTGRKDVIVVAPDAGASKHSIAFANKLNLSYALAEKHRPQPGVAEIQKIVGDFADKNIAIILDDMIASAGTIHALVKKLVKEHGIGEVYIGASHNLCIPDAYDRLLDLANNYHLKKIIVTNSIPQNDKFKQLPFLEIKCLSDVLARVINRIHYGESVSGISQIF